jgi:uncharacterized membrane protein (UPF0136 family)
MTGFILAYALLVAVGGVMGYVKAKSQQSLISGLVSGVLLAIAYGISLQNPMTGFAIAACAAIGLVIVFALRFRATGKFMPAGVLALFSLVAAGLFGYSLLG